VVRTVPAGEAVAISVEMALAEVAHTRCPHYAPMLDGDSPARFHSSVTRVWVKMREVDFTLALP
jgi:hypothetical protein